MDFEKAFEQFIDREEYDSAENALFLIVRTAFKAGWLAAGGNPLFAQPVILQISCKPDEIREESLKANMNIIIYHG